MKDIKHDLFYRLVDSLFIIRGNAQLASEIEHPRWNKHYVQLIIEEIDKVSRLLKQIEIIYDISSANHKTSTGTRHKISSPNQKKLPANGPVRW